MKSNRSWALRKEELKALNYMQHLYIQHGKVAIKPEVFKRLRGLIAGNPEQESEMSS